MVEAYTIYKLYKKQRRKGSSASWEDVMPSVFSIDGDGTMPEVIVKSNATECGYEEEAKPIYKWEDAVGEYICDECGDMPDPTRSPYYYQYLTFDVINGGKIIWTASRADRSANKLSWSINGGEWKSISLLSGSSHTIMVEDGDKIRFKANISPDGTGVGYFTNNSSGGNALFNVYGNAHSLLYGDDFIGQDTLKTNYVFNRLFDYIDVVDASNLILPALTLRQYCYSRMFYNCTSLTKAPALPATTLQYNCYEYMFFGCTSLQEAPELPALEIQPECYWYMFYNCTSLTKAPALPATTLRTNCYRNMFYGCTSLTKAPKLPATTLDNNCYSGMFSHCTSLQEAPELPATKLYNGCYDSMFAYCISLQEGPVLPATTLTSNCYVAMFSNCYSLNKITTMQLTTPLSGYHSNWTKNTPSTGTIYLNKNITWNPESYRGDSGIPEGWEVIKI